MARNIENSNSSFAVINMYNKEQPIVFERAGKVTNQPNKYLKFLFPRSLMADKQNTQLNLN